MTVGMTETTCTTMLVSTSELMALVTERDHLRAQRDELQRCNTMLVEARRAVDWTAQLRTMFDAFEQERPGYPGWPDDATVKLRRKLIVEEFNETMQALDERDFVETVDGVIDLCVVALGLLIAFGVDPRPVWDEVMRSNLSKAGGPKSADGKMMKRPGWSPPDLVSVLKAAGWTPPSEATGVGGGR